MKIGGVNLPDSRSFEPWFEDQYHSPYTVPIEVGPDRTDELRVVEIIPPGFDDRSDQTGLMVASGILSGIAIQKRLLYEAANRGFKVAAVDHANKPRPVAHDLPFNDRLVQNAEDILAAQMHLGYEEADIIAHSMGLITTILLSKMDESRVRRVVAAHPAGMYQLGLLDMAGVPKMFAEGTREMTEEHNRVEMAVAVMEKLFRPTDRARESWAVLNTVVAKDVPEFLLHSSLGVVLGDDDPVISTKRVLGSLEEHGIELDAIEVDQQENIGHLATLRNLGTMGLVFDMLEGLPIRQKQEEIVVS